MPKRNIAQVELMLKQGKSNARILMNTCLLLIVFAILAFVATKNFDLLRFNNFLAIQLTLSIPFLMTSTLANSKLTYTLHEIHWDNFGWATYIIGYAFLLNSIGILLADMVGSFLALVFFAATVCLSLVYSAVEVSYNKNCMNRRLAKDLLFFIIIFLLGILPILS
jgi:hypothetical protein